jgi:Uma2 family endonuclease
MSAYPHGSRLLTPEEYLAFEEAAVDRHEYNAGRVRMMAGGTFNHSCIIMNMGAALVTRLKGKPCRALDSNLRVKISRKKVYTYPDISVVCGPVEFDSVDKSRGTILNPKLLIEVLSPSTERYDRGDKFLFYSYIDSLEQYVLISQR